MKSAVQDERLVVSYPAVVAFLVYWPPTYSCFYHAAILQRVLSASVTVEKEVVSSIGRGVLVFAAVAPGDTEKEAESLAAKVLKMKLWDDEAGGRVWLRRTSLLFPPLLTSLMLRCSVGRRAERLTWRPHI